VTDSKQLIVLALQVAIIGTVFGFGLRATLDDVLYVLRRPGLLTRSVVAVLVVMPMLAVVFVKVFDLRTTVEVVLVALALSPVPPLLPRKEKKAGGLPSFGLGLMLVLAVAAIAVIPLSAAVLDHVFDRPIAMEPGAIARIVVTMVLVPLLAGMMLRKLAPRIAEWLDTSVRWIANGLLLIGVTLLLIGTWQAIWAATGGGAVLAIIAFVAVGLLVGHLMGGPQSEHSTVLALSTACRHPAIALAIASSNYPDERFGGTIILYVLVSAVAGLPYVAWRRRANFAAAA
jgi:BASS family bile acid:Na+ symporter